MHFDFEKVILVHVALNQLLHPEIAAKIHMF